MPDGTVISNIPDDVEPQKVIDLYTAHLQGNKDAVLAPDISGLTAAGMAMRNALGRTVRGIEQIGDLPLPDPHIGDFHVLSPEMVLAHRAISTIGDALKFVSPYIGVRSPQQVEADKPTDEAIAEDHPIANFLGNVAFQAPTKGPLGMAALAALQEGTPVDRLLSAGTTFAFAKGGEKLGEKAADAVKGMFTKAESRIAGKESQLANDYADKGMDLLREQTLDKLHKAGLVVPPSQANPQNPGIINRVAEGISGKIQTQQQASINNQPIVNNLVKQDLGIDPSQPITIGAMKTIRQNAANAYGAIPKALNSLHIDDQFQQDIGKAVAPYLLLKGSFPDTVGNKAIEGMTKDLAGKSEIDSNAAINLVRYLRAHGFRNQQAAVVNNNPEAGDLGKVQLAVSNALEDLIDRNLQMTQQPGLLTAFRSARSLIAKTFSAQNALEESTGKVVAGKLAQQLARGKPLSGNMETIARAAQMFPKAFQNINSSMPGLSPWDAGASIMLGGVGGPQAALLPLLRPALRKAILSPQWQSLLLPSGPDAAAAPLLGMSAQAASKFLPPALSLLGGAAGAEALGAHH